MEFAIACGESMLPIIQNGDILVLSKKEYQLGDIIVYDTGTTIFTHRLIKNSPPYLVAKGDNLLFPDSPLKTNWVIGVVVNVIRTEEDGRNYSYDIIAEANKKQLFVSKIESTITYFLGKRIKKNRLKSFLKQPFYFFHQLIFQKYYLSHLEKT